MTNMIKAIINIFILAAAINATGSLIKLTLSMGEMAADASQKGFMSMSQFNRALVGPSEFPKAKASR